MKEQRIARAAVKRALLAILLIVATPVIILGLYKLYEEIALKMLNLPDRLFPGRTVILMINESGQAIQVLSLVAENKIEVVDHQLERSDQKMFSIEQRRYREFVEVSYQAGKGGEILHIRFLSDRSEFDSCQITLTFLSNGSTASPCSAWPLD